MDETELIKAAQQGQGQAMSSLLEEYYDTLYRFAYKFSGQPSDAEDIAQQACIKLAQTIGQFRFEAAFSSWLYRIVLSCAHDWQRKESRHRDNIDTDELPDLADEDDNQHETSLYLRQVLKLLETMAEGFKETALLVFAEGLSHKEAAYVLGVKESTVSWRLHSIRKQLSQDPEGQAPEGEVVL